MSAAFKVQQGVSKSLGTCSKISYPACLYHIRPKTLAPAFVEQMSAQEIPNQNLDFKGHLNDFIIQCPVKKPLQMFHCSCQFCAPSC